LSSNEGGALNSYSLEPELLTADASVKIGKPQNLTFEELPPVLVKAILSIEDRGSLNITDWMSGASGERFSILVREANFTFVRVVQQSHSNSLRTFT
jgi:hypothetical protein